MSDSRKSREGIQRDVSSDGDVAGTRAAIGVHHTATSADSWDGPANKARLKNDGSAAYYRSAFAWVDPDGDAETKAAYKFIHHEVGSDGAVGAANLKAAVAGIAILNGARGGTKIPSADRKGVWSHLAAHLRDGDEEPPDLKDRGADLNPASDDEGDLNGGAALPPQSRESAVHGARAAGPAEMHRRGEQHEEQPEPADGAHPPLPTVSNATRRRHADARRDRIYDLREARLDGEDGGAPVISGYAAVFDSESDAGGDAPWVEVIRKGAFKKTIKEADVRALINHDPSQVLGRTKAKTLTLEEDDKGLRVEIRPPDTTYAHNLMKLMERGDVTQMSFGFRPVKDQWTEKKDEKPLRELLEVELFDVSAVTYPWYDETSVWLDTRRLDVVLQRARRGDLTPRDRELLEHLLLKVTEYCSAQVTDEPPQEGHSDEGGEGARSQARRASALYYRLRLAEIQGQHNNGR